MQNLNSETLHDINLKTEETNFNFLNNYYSSRKSTSTESIFIKEYEVEKCDTKFFQLNSDNGDRFFCKEYFTKQFNLYKQSILYNQLEVQKNQRRDNIAVLH